MEAYLRSLNKPGVTAVQTVHRSKGNLPALTFGDGDSNILGLH